METLVKSLGRGVLLAESDDESRAIAAIEQLGSLLEVWPDPEGGRWAVVLPRRDPACWQEARMLDGDVSSALRRAAVASPGGSEIRDRLKSIDADAASLLKEEGYVPAFSGV